MKLEAASKGSILLVVSDDQFGEELRAGISATPSPLSVDRVDPSCKDVEEKIDGPIEGAVIDGRIETPIEITQTLQSEYESSGVILTNDDEETASEALRAGVADIFPRLSSPEVCSLIMEAAVDGYERSLDAKSSQGVTRETGNVPPTGGDDTDLQSEGAYQEVFENVADGLVVHDPDTNEIVDVNQQFCRMNGYSREELIGADIGTVTAGHEGFATDEARDRIAAAEEEGPQLFEWRNERQSGETYPVEVHLAVMELAGTRRVLATVRDITERKRRERELNRNKRRFQLIADHIDEIIYLVSADYSEILYINSTYEDIYGRSKTELEENPQAFVEAAHPDDRDRYEADVEELIDDVQAGDTDAAYGDEYRICRDGETRWVDVTRFPVENADGEIDRVVGRVEDITKRKRREHEYEQIFDGVQDAIVVHDPETEEMVDVNERLCELLGYDRETILEMGTGGISVNSEGYTQQRAEQVIREVMEEGRAGPFEWKVKTRDGETRILEVVATTAEIGGEIRHISINRDITRRRQREREFEQIFHGVHNGITINDPETGELLEVNDSFCDLLGYDRETILSRGVAGISAAKKGGFTFERAREIVRDVMTTGESRQFEWAVETADGETRWLEVRGTVGEIGGELRYLSVTRDVTERRRREQEYERIFNGVQDALLVFDPETLDILDVNNAYVELFGYDDAETIQELGVEGLSLTNAGYTPDEGYKIHQRVAETGESELVEWWGQNATGEPICLEVKIAPAIINGEQVTIASNRDVTERRQLERRFRTIAERVDEIIYLANADLTDVLYVNDAYEEIFGRPTDELEEDPRAFLEAIHDSDRDKYEKELETMLADIQANDPAQRYEFEYRVQRPDGEIRWVEQTGYPIQGETNLAHRFVGVTKDVTERHRREETLETFHEATRELTEADSQKAASRTAARAAEDILGFPLVSVHLYDNETGELSPAAVTTGLEDLDVDPPSFAPGESIPWQVFVDRESVTSKKEPLNVYDQGISAPDVILPLGPHGVMVVGSQTDAFETEDLELAQILAATLEAALNHVSGEQELEQREEELRHEQQRAERLKRLNGVIRDIEQLTVDQTSRGGIEEAVCERLTDTELADLVWIGEPSVGSDAIVPRVNAGEKPSYVDALTVGEEAVTAAHPAVAAYQHGEVRTIENIATGATGGDWRKTALRHGIQSVIAVPIRYETTVHGTLVVAATTPDAFDEATCDVLGELGRSIGYAISVIEREQALESEGTTELEFSIEDDGLLLIRGATTADCEVRLERTVRRGGGMFSMFYLVQGGDPDSVVDLAIAAPSVETAQVVSAAEDRQSGLVEVTAPTWFGEVFTDHGAVVRKAVADGVDGRLIVEAPRGADVREIVEGFQQRYPDTELAAQRQLDRTIRSLFELQELLADELTDRQWEALETAHSAGYFAWPRDVSGEDVADLLGVTQPTFNKHLRLAEQTAFRMLLDREYSDQEN